MAKVAEGPQVADNGKILEVPKQLPLECCPLLANWFMPVLATPLRDALESTPKPVCGSLLLHHPISLAGHGPIVGEAQSTSKSSGDVKHSHFGRNRARVPAKLAAAEIATGVDGADKRVGPFRLWVTRGGAKD